MVFYHTGGTTPYGPTRRRSSQYILPFIHPSEKNTALCQDYIFAIFGSILNYLLSSSLLDGATELHYSYHIIQVDLKFGHSVP